MGVSLSGGTDQIAFGTMSDERDDVFSAHFRWGLGRVYLTKQSFIADWESSTLDAALIEEMERELEIEEHECLFVAFDAVQIGKRAEPYYEIKQISDIALADNSRLERFIERNCRCGVGSNTKSSLKTPKVMESTSNPCISIGNTDIMNRVAHP